MVSSPAPASKPSCAAFQSHPTDMELVNSYLRPWVESGLKAGTFIHEADVYAADPAELTRRFAPAVAQDGERAWYFFTPLRHKSVRGKRMTRTVATGDGCWHNEAKSKPVYRGFGGRRLIGHRQSFSFVIKQGSQRVRTGWLMLELRLRKEGDDAMEAPDEDEALGNLVLCKVYRSPRHPKPADSDPAAEPQASDPKGEADSGDSSPATADDGEGDGEGDGSGPAAQGDDDDDSGPATLGDDDDSAHTPPPPAAGSRRKRRKSDDGGARAAAAPRRHKKADVEISSAAPAPGPTEKAAGDEDPAELAAEAALGLKTKAAGDDDPTETPTGGPGLKTKAAGDDGLAAAAGAAPGSKRKADGGSGPVAPVPVTAELQCPCCGAHFGVELTPRLSTKPAAEIAKDGAAPGASDAVQGGDEARGSSAKKDARPFHQFL